MGLFSLKPRLLLPAIPLRERVDFCVQQKSGGGGGARYLHHRALPLIRPSGTFSRKGRRGDAQTLAAPNCRPGVPRDAAVPRGEEAEGVAAYSKYQTVGSIEAGVGNSQALNIE